MLAHGGDAGRVLRELRPADLHLDGAKATAEIAVGLGQEGVEREVEIDAAGIAGDARVVAAEQLPQGQAGAPGLQVPERHVEGREGEDVGHRPAIVQRPPELLPERLHAPASSQGQLGISRPRVP